MSNASALTVRTPPHAMVLTLELHMLICPFHDATSRLASQPSSPHRRACARGGLFVPRPLALIRPVEFIR